MHPLGQIYIEAIIQNFFFPFYLGILRDLKPKLLVSTTFLDCHISFISPTILETTSKLSVTYPILACNHGNIYVIHTPQLFIPQYVTEEHIGRMSDSPNW